jgi:hypothetical protein
MPDKNKENELLLEIAKSLKDLHTKIDNLEKKVDSLQMQHNRMFRHLTAVENELDKTIIRIDSIEYRLNS